MARKNKTEFNEWKDTVPIREVVIDDIDEPVNNTQSKRIERFISTNRYLFFLQDHESWFAKPTVYQFFVSREAGGKRIQRGLQFHLL